MTARALASVVLLLCAGVAVGAGARPRIPVQDPDAAGARTETFVAYDVFVDAGGSSLAAWQLELEFASAKLVGIEGGDAMAFRDAPIYDPAALQGDRVVLAALADGGVRDLVSGRTRVARIHVLAVEGDGNPRAARKVVAADEQGQHIEVDVQVRRHRGK